MLLPRVIHRIWIGSMPTEEQLQILTEARQYVKGSTELWLWTTPSLASRFQRDNLFMNNIIVRNINPLWSHAFASDLPVSYLHSVFERESRGAFNDNAAASDIARLMILYCYGGIYLDMDVLFKTADYCLFHDLTDIGDRLGMLKTNAGGGGMGNGVLAVKPRSNTVKACLEKIKELYCSGASEKLSWSTKRGYGGMRMFLTVRMSGPQAILDAIQPEQIYPIQESKYFALIDATGLSYTRRPGVMRRESVPAFTR